MVKLEFWMPMPPREVNNTRAHWAVHGKAKKKYWAELDQRARAKFHFPPPPPAPLERATLRATFYFKSSSHFMDDDNRSARLKRVIDYLREYGYIKGDRSEQLNVEKPAQTTFSRAGKTVVPVLCSLYLELEGE